MTNLTPPPPFSAAASSPHCCFSSLSGPNLSSVHSKYGTLIAESYQENDATDLGVGVRVADAAPGSPEGGPGELNVLDPPVSVEASKSFCGRTKDTSLTGRVSPTARRRPEHSVQEAFLN